MKEPHITPEITDDFVKMHEEILVPVIFSQWAHRVADIAEIYPGHHVLDVACGTGPLARAAKLEAGLTGKVTGLDHNDKMLASAAAHSRAIEWQNGDAGALPFENNQFDRVLCQFSLMFINNRMAAIKEMLRVCKPDGLVVLAIWAPLDHSKAYGTLIDLVQRHAGRHAAFKLSSPWALGKPGIMDNLLLTAGVNEYVCHERVGLAHFPSVETFIETHLRLVGEFDDLDEDKYRQLLKAGESELLPFVVPGGQIVVHLDANIFTVSDE